MAAIGTCRHSSLSTGTCTGGTFSCGGLTIRSSTFDWTTRSTVSPVTGCWPMWSTSLYQESTKVGGQGMHKHQLRS